MYYQDLLVAAEKDIASRNFCNLVDAAVEVYEEEKRKSKTKTEREIDTNDKRFFPVFPRKPRTSVTKRNLNGASSSSSSSFLLDLNTIPPDDFETNHPQNPSSSSSFLRDYKNVVAEMRNPQNPSSSSPFLGDYKNVVAEMRNPQNPSSQSSLSSCLTEMKSGKRRAVQDTKRSGKSKKAKVEAYSWRGKEAPEWLIERVRDMNGSDLRLIFERNLFKTDVNPGESRLSMPFNELIDKDFLNPDESRIIEEDIFNVKKTGIQVILVNQQNVQWSLMLKRWEMKKESGKGSWTYALNNGWNDVVKGNGLKQGHDISIWSFRWRELLCFALVRPPPPPSPAMPQSSSSLDLTLKL